MRRGTLHLARGRHSTRAAPTAAAAASATTASGHGKRLGRCRQAVRAHGVRWRGEPDGKIAQLAGGALEALSHLRAERPRGDRVQLFTDVTKSAGRRGNSRGGRVCA